MNSYREAYIYVNDLFSGILKETDSGYSFKYDSSYLKVDNALPVSLTLPLKEKEYLSNSLFSFFDGLIPEGWVLDKISKKWNIPIEDRFGILLVACKDPIGNVQVMDKKI